MKEFEIVGMKTIGNVELLQKPHARIGVYASRQLDNAESIIRKQWAISKGSRMLGPIHARAVARGKLVECF